MRVEGRRDVNHENADGSGLDLVSIRSVLYTVTALTRKRWDDAEWFGTV